MNWYLVPIFAETVSEGQFAYYPGVGLPGAMFRCPTGPCLIHAHNPKPAPTSALLGLPNPVTPLPAGWVSKTLDEAKAHFESVTGRPPSALEVF